MSDTVQRYIRCNGISDGQGWEAVEDYLHRLGISIDPRWHDGSLGNTIILRGEATAEEWAKVKEASLTLFERLGEAREGKTMDQQRERQAAVAMERKRQLILNAIDQGDWLACEVADILPKLMDIRDIPGFHNHWLVTTWGMSSNVPIRIHFVEDGRLVNEIEFPTNYLWRDDWEAVEREAKR